MSKTKIVIALVAITAIALVAIGLASAQIAANQTYTGTTTNTSAPNSVSLAGLDVLLTSEAANPTTAAHT